MDTPMEKSDWPGSSSDDASLSDYSLDNINLPPKPLFPFSTSKVGSGVMSLMFSGLRCLVTEGGAHLQYGLQNGKAQCAAATVGLSLLTLVMLVYRSHFLRHQSCPSMTSSLPFHNQSQQQRLYQQLSMYMGLL